MIQTAVTITVYFDDPFWAGIVELNSEKQLRISKTVFGSEPKDYEIYSFILNYYYSLNFSRPVKTEQNPEKKINPKRMKRQINRQLKEKSISTKAQQALQKSIKENKQEGKILSKEMKEQYKKERFEMKQIKKKKKKRGH